MKTESRLRIIVLFACVMLFTMTARGDYVTIDLNSFANSDLTTFTGGFHYPQNGGSITVDGMPFILPTIGWNQDTAVVFPRIAFPFRSDCMAQPPLAFWPTPLGVFAALRSVKSILWAQREPTFIC